LSVDGANAVRQFLTAHKVPAERVQLAWEAIALHTTPGVTQYMRPEVALLYSAVGLDALGKGFDQFPSDLPETVVARYPRKHFKENFIQEYFAGFEHKPGATYGTVNAAVCERLMVISLQMRAITIPRFRIAVRNGKMGEMKC
jgi:hypothetical protein